MSDDFTSSGGSWGGSEEGGTNDGEGGSSSETSSESWSGRIGKAITGVPFGLIFVGVALYLLWWNEGRAVDTANALAETGANVVTVSSDKVDPANEAKLVHTTGTLVTEGTAKDDLFGLQAPKDTVILARIVKMYQWHEKKEEKKRTGGGTTTTYSYSKGWYDHAINSSGFHNVSGHQNPAWPDNLRAKDFLPDKVTLGAFTLPAKLIHQVGGAQPFSVKEEDVKNLPDGQTKFHVEGGAFYRGKGSDSEPKIGDIKISFKTTPVAPASVIAEQTQNTFRAYQPKTATSSIEMLSNGNKSAKEMIAQAESENATMTWLLRLVGFIFVAVGIFLVFYPLVVIADFLPILGDITGMVMGMFSLMLALVLSFVTIAIAWIVFRPLLAYSLLAIAAVAFIGAVAVMIRARSRPPIPKEKAVARKVR